MMQIRSTSLLIVAMASILLVIQVNGYEDSVQANKKDISQERQEIYKEMDETMNDLAQLKREAISLLSRVKQGGSDPTSGTTESTSERIRRTKVGRFVLRKVVELEGESMKLREELNKAFDLGVVPSHFRQILGKQEDHDFEDSAPTSSSKKPTTSGSTSQKPNGMPASSTTTMSPEQEAAKIGFDVEALVKLGEEIGKRLDQFGKEAAKNLGDLVEGVKLVFREPKTTKKPSTSSR